MLNPTLKSKASGQNINGITFARQNYIRQSTALFQNRSTMSLNC